MVSSVEILANTSGNTMNGPILMIHHCHVIPILDVVDLGHKCHSDLSGQSLDLRSSVLTLIDMDI